MANKDKIYVEVPEEIVKQFNIIEGTEFNVNYSGDGFDIKVPTNQNKHHYSFQLLLSFIIGVIGSIIYYLNQTQIPLTGYRSIASVVIVLGTITSMINFTYVYIKNKKTNTNPLIYNLYWRNFPIVILAYTALVVVGSLFAFRIMNNLFLGASFDYFTASYLSAIFILIINYIMINLSENIKPKSLIHSLIYIILGGVGIAMITNRDQQWWLYNFSFLGTPEASKSWEFNLTLILSSLLMVALIDYLFRLIYTVYGKKKNYIILKWLLIITALCLGGVGLFPYNESIFYQNMHNRMASYLVYMFIILIIAIRFLLPNISRKFLWFSYGLCAVLVLAIYLFLGIGYLSLTAFEMSAFGIAFIWLLKLLDILINMVDDYGSVKVMAIKK